MGEQQITRRLAAVLAADVAGYSRMIERDEAGTVTALRQIWIAARLINNASPVRLRERLLMGARRSLGRAVVSS